MSNVANLAAHALAKTEIQPEALTDTKQLFMMLHGMYGNLFVSKFATGELNENRKDKGILSAMKVWDSSLRKYYRQGENRAQIIEAALQACKTKHVEFPPSLPQFMALCDAELETMPRPTFFEKGGTGRVLVGVDEKFMEERRKRLAAAAFEKMRKFEKKQSNGLPLIQQLVAQACALAGADEVATLRNLERKCV